MKRNAVKLALMILALMVTLPLTGKETPQFGHVNISLAVIMHPLMARFEPSDGRFSIDIAAKLGKTFQTAENKKEVLDKQKKEVRAAIEKLEQDLKRVESDYAKSLAGLKPPKNTNTDSEVPGSGTAEYNRERRTLETEFRRQVLAIRRDIQRMEREEESLNSRYATASMTNTDETGRVFSLILDDVYAAVNEVATHYKIPFVFNSSLSFDRTQVTDLRLYENPIKMLIEATDAEIIEGEREHVLLASFGFWAGISNRLVSASSDPRMGRFVIKGGVDMTPAVIDMVYQKYKVDKHRRELVQKFFKQE